MIPPGNEKCNAAQSMIFVQHDALPLSFRLFPNRRQKPRKRPQRAVLQEIIADFWPMCNHFAQFSCISSPEDRACSLAIQPKSHYNITYHYNLYYKRIIRRVYDLSGLVRQYPGRRSGFTALLRGGAQLPGQCKFPPCSRHCRKGGHRRRHPEHCPQSECAARRDHLYIRCQ